MVEGGLKPELDKIRERVRHTDPEQRRQMALMHGAKLVPRSRPEQDGAAPDPQDVEQ